MDKILKEFYHGMIHPEEQYQPTAEIRRERREIDDRQLALLEQLKRIDPELFGEMNDLIETENRVDAMEMEETYIRGMRMGARLALGLMDHRKE